MDWPSSPPPTPQKAGVYQLLGCCGGKEPREYTALEQLEDSTSGWCTGRCIAIATVLAVGAAAVGTFALAPGLLEAPLELALAPFRSGTPTVPNGGSLGGGVATTLLSENHPVGATEIQVKSSQGFEVGDSITISNGDEYSEEKNIVEVGSIILDTPLEHEFPVGSKVTKKKTAKKGDDEEASEGDEKSEGDDEEASEGDKEADKEAANVDPEHYGPELISFYLYRATGDTDYPLENVNVGDLPGVMWYLHNEIVGAPVRKYGIDRIRRYKIKMRPVVEFWNVHHTYFGPFMAYDMARCQTPACEDVYRAYGYMIGCQPVTPGRSGYEAMEDTMSEQACSSPEISCKSPMWYSLPGACPLKKISEQTISDHQKDHGIENALNPTLVAHGADEEKTDECRAAEPGGRCDEPNGAPDCVYSVEDAGEIMIDELAGTLPSFGEWFINISVTREYNTKTDKGIGCSFWDGRDDTQKCMDRLTAALAMFEQKHGVDSDLTKGQPVCDFDGWYDGEFPASGFTWPRNHTGAFEPSRGFTWKEPAAVA